MGGRIGEGREKYEVKRRVVGRGFGLHEQAREHGVLVVKITGGGGGEGAGVGHGEGEEQEENYEEERDGAVGELVGEASTVGGITEFTWIDRNNRFVG
jgi:hypothetical protein